MNWCLLMRMVPPLKEMYPEFAEEFEKTKLPTVITKLTPEMLPPPKACRERPDGWWREPPYSEWITDRGREPTTYELFLDFIIGKAMKSPRAMELASLPPSRLIHYEIEHPKRGIEHVRLFMNPTDVLEGPPEEEPDLIIHMDYYSFLAVLSGEISSFVAIYEGRGWVLGNTTAGLDQFDIQEAVAGREVVRPKCWSRGHP